MKSETIQKIEQARIVAIIRLNEQMQVKSVMDALVEAGIQVLEVTSNTPGYGVEISRSRKEYPQVLIGAGTIVDREQAKQAIGFGAQFIVTPNMNVEVISVAHEVDIPVIMGAMTPTEVALGVRYGADFIKLFPAATLGPDYMKALKGPFDTAKFMAVGGVDHTNVQDWLDAGAVGVGVGGLLTNGKPKEIEGLVKRFVNAME